MRLHFVHARSPHNHAVPLLLIPPFPFTSLSLGHLVRPLAEPEDPATQQPFHVVVPSLPGLGFSDALPSDVPAIPAVAGILDAVMARLSYPAYVASNTASAAASPAQIDWKLARHLASNYAGSCVGVHFISPPLAAPRLADAPLEWAKWSIAKFFRAPILGYRSEDFRSLDRAGTLPPSAESIPTSLIEPNTPSFALCDSPVGLLALVLKVLRVLGARKELSPTDVVTMTQAAWLPGPESAMRFWAHCAAREEELPKKKAAARPRIALTVFSGDEGARQDDVEARAVSPRPPADSYACPAWANVSYDVLHTQRVPGVPGLVAWDSPELIFAGVRGLAKELLSKDGRLRGSGTAPLQGVTVQSDSAPAQPPRTPGETVPSTPQAEASWRLERIRETSETPKKSSKDGGRADADADFDQASPDTIVVTPPSN